MQSLLLLISLLLLSGCNPTPRDATQSSASDALAQERQHWQEAENERNQQTARADRWKSIAFAAFAFTGTALILGSILGSRARDDAEK